jgi:hypothetical protein
MIKRREAKASWKFARQQIPRFINPGKLPAARLVFESCALLHLSKGHHVVTTTTTTDLRLQMVRSYLR